VTEPGFFDTLRMPLLRGRDFDEKDREGAPPVAIVNETLARRLWPDQDAIGKQLIHNEGTAAAPSLETLTVIGVARDAKYRSLGEAPRMFVYVPLQQHDLDGLTLFVRTTHGRKVGAEVRALIASMNPNLPLLMTQTLEESAAIALVPQRVAGALSGVLGIIGLLLATIGIYGVTAFTVSTRTREIAIRKSLGAERGDILSMVLRQGLRLVVIGVTIGILLAAAVSRIAASLLFGVAPTDAVAFGGAALLCCAVGLAACWLPAHRAMQIEPTEALRWE